MTFITLEGIDGTGKSTLHAEIGVLLADMNPVMTREPGGTPTGLVIRDLIKSGTAPYTEAFLFAADHAQHLHEVIIPSIQDNRLIISDRYYDSRLAYQQVTLSLICPDPIAFIKKIHEGLTIVPDHTFLLILDPKVAYERSKQRGITDHFETIERLRQFQAAYLQLAEAEPSRFTIIDGALPTQEIASCMQVHIRNLHAKSNARRPARKI